MASAIQTRCMATGARHELRMILVGKTGSGKSSIGNTILGESNFETAISPYSITTQCTCAFREFHGKRLFVVDTPGFLDPSVTRKDIQQEVAKSYQMTALPGPHVFLLALEPVRFTAQEFETIDYLRQIFGPQAINHTIIIFTHDDELARQGTTIQNYLGRLKADHPLKKIMDQCGQRYLSVNNLGTDAEKTTTVEALLKLIAEMIAMNGGQVYRSATFDAVAGMIETEMARGTYNPFESDGSYTLLPKTTEIVIEGFLRRSVGRKVAS